MALITLFGGAAFYWRFDQLIQQNLRGQLEEISLNKQQQLSELTHLAVDQLKSIPENEAKEVATLAVLKDHLSRSVFREIGLLSPDGLVILSTNPDHLGKDLSQNSCFIQGKNDTHISSLVKNFTNLAPTILVSMPIKNADNTLVAVLVGAIDDSYITKILTQKMGVPVTQVGLANSAAVIGTVDPAVVATCLSEPSAELQFAPGYNSYYLWDAQTQTCLFHRVDPFAAHFFIQPTYHLLGYLAVIVGLTFSITWILSSFFSKEISKIIQGIDQLQNHDYIHPIGASSNPEINHSLIALDRLRDRFQQMHNDIESAVVTRTIDLNRKLAALEKFRDVTTDMIIKSDSKSKHDH